MVLPDKERINLYSSLHLGADITVKLPLPVDDTPNVEVRRRNRCWRSFCGKPEWLCLGLCGPLLWIYSKRVATLLFVYSLSCKDCRQIIVSFIYAFSCRELVCDVSSFSCALSFVLPLSLSRSLFFFFFLFLVLCLPVSVKSAS